MANLHILEGNGGSGKYRVALHFAAPSGNNAAGLSWKAVFLAAGITGTSALTTGTAPGNISSAELATLVSGDVMELITTLKLKSGGQTAGSVNEMVAREINAYRSTLQQKYDQYGREV